MSDLLSFPVMPSDQSDPKPITLKEQDFPMRQPIVITTPYPTPEEIAQEYGVSQRRLKELQALVTDFLSPSPSRKTKARKSGPTLSPKAPRHQSRASDR